MARFHQLLLIATFLPLCWFAVMAVHELGHIVGASVTGGSATKVVLHPFTISRTDVSPNPRPLAVAWAGPMVGVLAPLAMLAVFKLAHVRWWYLIQFFAGFCLIANGAYVGVGSFDKIGDAGEMLRQGCPAWCLWLFGLAAVPLGLFLWHGLGRHFGLAHNGARVDRGAAYVSCGLLLATLLLEFALSPR
jgi:hypothetical protein